MISGTAETCARKGKQRNSSESVTAGSVKGVWSLTSYFAEPWEELYMQNLFALQCRKAGFNLPGRMSKFLIFQAKLHDFLPSGARMEKQKTFFQKLCQLSNTGESVLIVDVMYVPTSV